MYRQVNNHQTQHVGFPGRFSNHIFTGSAHFINVGNCVDVTGINLKTVMTSTT